MFETVTVDEALRKGKRIINLPVYIILFGTIGVSVYLVSVQKVSGWYTVAGTIGAFVFAWMYWSFAITKWRLWAFENVRNVHELKQRAVKEKLIWPDGNFLEKTEIRTADERQKLLNLNDKFNQPDVFTDDYSVPDEKVVHYSKAIALFQILLMMAFFVGGLYALIYGQSYIIGGLLTVVGAVFTYTGFSHYRNRSAQIIINNKGIQTAAIQFYPWQEIYAEDVITQRYGKSSTTYFIYNHPGGSEKLDINEFDISKKELEKLLRIYRGRSEKSTTSSRSN
jgi:hypothetical protein